MSHGEVNQRNKTFCIVGVWRKITRGLLLAEYHVEKTAVAFDVGTEISGELASKTFVINEI